MSETIEKSALYLVATPLGNLGDISRRAAEVLCGADLVACEDTRTSRRLLDFVGSKVPTLACHEYNEREVVERLADRVAAGETVALVSDAGTPNISDPGFRMVRECRRRGLKVIPIPGPCALVTALCASGLPTNAFFYAGFLPPKSAARVRFLEANKNAPHTLILYESCHRIAAFAQEIVQVLGPERTVCIARELTKLHETFRTGPAAAVAATLEGSQLKGEFVVLIAPEGYAL